MKGIAVEVPFARAGNTRWVSGTDRMKVVEAALEYAPASSHREIRCQLRDVVEGAPIGALVRVYAPGFIAYVFEVEVIS